MIGLLALAMLSPDDGLIRVDDRATMRWVRDGREVALFGANYCLPSALDFRAAAATGVDKKAMVRQDMAHFARMGFDGLRLSFWGDWENADKDGNLRVNEHLDVMDYVIAEGAKRGIKFLLSPIVTYDARWPEMREYPAVADSLTRFHTKGKLGTDPAAIRAQQNYLRQLLNHVNPYTGRTLKDEPSIAFVEMINEPWHHPEDAAGSVRYIDALVQAVRDTGGLKPTFHNLSQDFQMLGPINDSKVDGLTYGWYPTGLNANRELRGNFLRYMDDYAPMRRPEVQRKPSLVYEFDIPDTDTGYAYPAMVREFRKTGAQYAAMFSYDMAATAPYNLGWTTHLLNLVYTPKKAASAVIAGEAMRRLPRFKEYGRYPANRRFGDFRVDAEQDMAELNAADALMYSGDTRSRPPDPGRLRRIAGYGSSPVVRYPGRGMYFLDRIDAGRWRLEVYPDVLKVDDPFRNPQLSDLKFRLLAREWPMAVNLPDLGSDFRVEGLDHSASAVARKGQFAVRPGVYLLERPGAKGPLPRTVAGMGLREFVCPEPTATRGKPSVRLDLPRAGRQGEPFTVRAQVVSDADPGAVEIRINRQLAWLRRVAPYRYEATIRPTEPLLGFELTSDGLSSPPTAVRFYAPGAPVRLFDPQTDIDGLAVSRSGEARNRMNTLADGSEPGRKALNFRLPPALREAPEDLTISTFIGDLPLAGGRSVSLRLRGKSEGAVVHLTLVDREGNAWGAPIRTSTAWRSYEIPLSELKPVRWVMLPQAFPSDWSYWADSLPRARLRPERFERLQLSLRRADGTTPGGGVEVEAVQLEFRS